MSEVIKYDVVMIGSSPISMIKLILEYRKNQNVLILDNAKNFGGNWQVQRIHNYNNVEIGPHNIKVKEKNFKIFDILNISYDINSFIPKYILPKSFFNINKVDRVFVPYVEMIMNRKISFQSILIILKIIYLFIKVNLFEKKQPKFFYPKGGCSKLIQGLKNQLIELEIKNILSINVLKIFENKSGLVEIKTNKGSFLTKKCILTSGFKNIKIFKNGKPLKEAITKKQRNCQIILVVNERPSKFPFYLNTINNHQVKAVNDVSHFSEYYKLKNNNERILSLRLSETALINEKNFSKDDIERWLKEVKIIKSKSHIIYIKRLSLPIPVRREKEINQLNKFSPKNIEFLYSFDMSIGLHYLKILKKNNKLSV